MSVLNPYAAAVKDVQDRHAPLAGYTPCERPMRRPGGQMGLIESEAEQLARLIVQQNAHLESVIMATAEQLQQAFTDQSAAFSDFANDVTATLADLKAKLDAALANDSADHAALAEMQALTDDALARTNNLTEAIKAADVAVDRPA